MIPIFSSDFDAAIKNIHKRTSYQNRPEAELVRSIVKDIAQTGNEALLKYVSQFEYPTHLFSDLRVDPIEVDLAHGRMTPEFLRIVRQAISNIRAYHEKTGLKSWVDPIYTRSTLGMKVVPIRRVGVYVPGGSAAYPSSVLMNVIPAQVAGVEEIVLVSPSNAQGHVNDAVLACCKELGITEIYRMGGAQGVAALAFGTEDLDPVDKIVGPGNLWVTLAKKEVFGIVGIDKLAGPSDVCIVADHGANPDFIAADMLAQAEHDALASAILITDSMETVMQVNRSLKQQFNDLPRQEIMREALINNSAAFVVNLDDLDEMARLVNLIAPEHLEIMHDHDQDLVTKIRNAGAIFIGEYSAEVLGDYMLGPNHVLPTGGTARFSSPLSVLDFVKTSSLISLNRVDYPEIGNDTATFADFEGLPAHANAARVRL